MIRPCTIIISICIVSNKYSSKKNCALEIIYFFKRNAGDYLLCAICHCLFLSQGPVLHSCVVYLGMKHGISHVSKIDGDNLDKYLF